jgi:hypothetical protein
MIVLLGGGDNFDDDNDDVRQLRTGWRQDGGDDVDNSVSCTDVATYWVAVD